MNIETTSEMPTKGQFVRFWEFKGLTWSTTYKYKDDGLYEYIGDDMWSLSCNILVEEATNVSYLVLDTRKEFNPIDNLSVIKDLGI